MRMLVICGSLGTLLLPLGAALQPPPRGRGVSGRDRWTLPCTPPPPQEGRRTAWTAPPVLLGFGSSRATPRVEGVRGLLGAGDSQRAGSPTPGLSCCLRLALFLACPLAVEGGMQGEGRLPGVREEDGPLGPYGAVKECPGVSTVPCTKDSSDPPSKPLCLTPVRPHPLPPAPQLCLQNHKGGNCGKRQS